MNPAIIDATNRQDFVFNSQYQALKDFMISQIVEVEKYLKERNTDRNQRTEGTLESATANVLQIEKAIQEIANKVPKFKKEISVVTSTLREVKRQIKQGTRNHKRLQTEIQQKERLFFSMITLQEYAARMAHLVRTAISGIKRRLEFISTHIEAPKFRSDAIRFAKEARQQLIHLDQAINHMLGYSQAATGTEDIDLSEAIRSAFLAYSDIFQKQGIKVELNTPESITVNFNRKMLEEVFENLITNSLKFLQGTKSPMITCTTSRTNNELIVRFKDNGPGISPEIQTRIFEPFFTTTSDIGGAGLGLYIVTMYVKSLNGTVYLEPTERGASFLIKLPAGV